MQKTLEKKLKKRLTYLSKGDLNNAKKIEDELSMFNIILKSTACGTSWNFRALFQK